MLYTNHMTIFDPTPDEKPSSNFEAITTNRANEFPKPTTENAKIIKEEVIHRITRWETSWGGSKPLEIGSVLGTAEKQAAGQIEEENRRRAIEGRPPVLPEEQLQLAISKAEDFLRGYWGERALANYPVKLAKTVYAGSEANPETYANYLVRDTNEAFENLRKDAVIRAYFLSNLENDTSLFVETKEDFTNRFQALKLPFNEQIAHTVISLHADVISDKEGWIKEFSEANPKNQRRPSDTELIKWVMEKRYTSVARNTPDWQFALKWSEYLLYIENSMVFRDSSEAITVAEAAMLESKLATIANLPESTSQETQAKKNASKKALKTVERYEDSLYFDLTVPDAILQDQRTGETVGIVEIKSYSAVEVKSWINALNYHFENEEYDEIPYGQDGLRVGVVVEPKLSTEDQLLQLGFNPQKEATFIKMANRVNAEGLEQTDKEFPMILRVLDDVEDADIEKLGDLIQRYGYHNFIIQKVGFTRKEIEKLAQETTRQNTPKILQTQGPQHEQLLRELSKKESWEE